MSYEAPRCESIRPKTGTDQCIYPAGHIGAHGIGHAMWETEETE